MSHLNYFEPNLKRKPSVQEKLENIKHLRTGHKSVFVDGVEGRIVPIMVTSCYNCGEPSPIITDGRFICRKCVLIFPKFKEKHYKKGVRHVNKQRGS